MIEFNKVRVDHGLSDDLQSVFDSLLTIDDDLSASALGDKFASALKNLGSVFGQIVEDAQENAIHARYSRGMMDGVAYALRFLDLAIDDENRLMASVRMVDECGPMKPAIFSADVTEAGVVAAMLQHVGAHAERVAWESDGRTVVAYAVPIKNAPETPPSHRVTPQPGEDDASA